MPLPWFRRHKQDDAQQKEVAAPAAPEVTEEEAQPAAAAASKPKRRRGSRGGRGRKKTPETKPETKTGRAETGRAAREKPREKERAERQGSQRRQRQQQQRRRAVAKRAPLPAAKRELLVSVDVTEQRVAVLEDGVVAEVYLERPERRSIAGNIYKGVVDNVLPGMEAAFVEIGLEKNGFLYVDEIVAPELEGKRHGKRIQDLISRGEELLVQAVKDPMKTKGARLTTDISLPGRFVVYVPNGEGLGVSRRLDDDERNRLKEIVKAIAPDKGGVIVRTAAEGASDEDVERDLVFLQRLWKQIQEKAKTAKAPTLVYQEAELPLRVTRDLFAGDFERALVDDERTYKRIVGYLKKTSPHMVERVIRDKDRTPLMERFGVDQEIRSTLSRRVDLPSGGYLVFDYAEAFTVVDVNTGRFVGSRSKSSGSRLEDTITKNNLEAVKEVVRQLRLRDIGGIIVIDFIDMASPKNRAAVEEALATELERDRTKTYVVEISPLGLVEMTRQNVTDGPREILTTRCPTCGGDGIVLSETSATVEVERRLRALATASPRTQAFRVEVNAKVASMLIGPGAGRLREIEAATRRRFFLVPEEDVHIDHVAVLAEGKLADLQPQAAVEEGAELELKLGEVGRYDASAGVGKLDGGLTVVVGEAAKLVGKKVKVRVERVLDGRVYGTLVEPGPAASVEEPITAESQAEKPTRQPGRRKKAEPATPATTEEKASPGDGKQPDVEAAEQEAAEQEAAEQEATEQEVAEGEQPEKPKRKTRRGSRGGRRRKRKPAAAPEAGSGPGESEDEGGDQAAAGKEGRGAAKDGSGRNGRSPRIHVPPPELGREDDEKEKEALAGGDENGAGEEAPKPKRKTRRGSRGGRNRRRKPAAGPAEAVTESEPSA